MSWMRAPGIVCLCGLAISPLAARANDTELTNSGTPKPLNGNTTVSMKREYVRMVVGDKLVTVDCRFTFENRGPARRVRVGFPDEGGEPGESLDPATGHPIPAQPSITSFHSWVGGKPVKTTAIPAGEDSGSFWHVKTVQFPANRTVEVRNRYTVPVGSSVAYAPNSVSLARYVLRTGASWRGNIGRSEVEVVFKHRGVTRPVRIIRLPENPEKLGKSMKTGGGIVYYSGPSRPTVSGRTLRFVRANWRPGPADDILLFFNIRRLKTEARPQREQSLKPLMMMGALCGVCVLPPSLTRAQQTNPEVNYFVQGGRHPRGLSNFQAFALYRKKGRDGKHSYSGWVMSDTSNPDASTFPMKSVRVNGRKLTFTAPARRGEIFTFEGRFLRSGDFRPYFDRNVPVVEGTVRRQRGGSTLARARLRFTCGLGG